MAVTRTIPDNQVLQHGMRGDFDQRPAVVIRHDIHAGRKNVIFPDEVDSLVGFLRGSAASRHAVAHEDNALDDIRVVVEIPRSQGVARARSRHRQRP